MQDIQKFSVTPEIEQRFTISKEKFNALVKDKTIVPYKTMVIMQWWIDSNPKYRIRIREEIKDMNKPKFYHTIKYSVKKRLDWEVTTPLSFIEFQTLYDGLELYKKDKEVKTRIYFKDKLNPGFVITADIKKNDAQNVYIEYEDKDKLGTHKLIKPEWLENTNENK